MDIAVNEGFPAGLVNKDDFNTPNPLTGCSVCAEDHESEKCSIFDNIIQIKDSKVLPRALLTLPPNLKVETLSDGTKTVIATECFIKGTQFGPYQAEKFYSLNPFDHFPIKIFGDMENILPDCYLDSRNEEKCNWMCYVSPASNFEEQNLICYQIKLEIFFSVSRDIEPGEHLKVWYSTYYAAKIGSKTYIPKQNEIIDPDEHEKIQKVAEKLPAKNLGAVERQNWCCKMCGHNETNVVKFAKHLQKHYLRMIKSSFICNICNSGFRTEKSLKVHRKFAHVVLTEHKPHDMENFIDNQASETEKSEIIEPCFPGPINKLVSVTLTESDQYLMLDPLDIPSAGIYNDLTDAETLRAILLDDNTKASKTAQEKSIADFSLEFVENNDRNDMIPKLQAPYYCDVCNKLFNKLHNLYMHLKKHTGEYTCVQCLIVFSRKENYLRHPCFNDSVLKKFNCSYCSKWFYQRKYLQRHLTNHLAKYPCTICRKKFKSQYDQKNHKCSPIAKDLHSCNHCSRKFFLEVYLQRHIRRCHLDKISQPGQPTICEICAKTYSTLQALRIHKQQHGEAKYECKICDKKFYRYDLYNNHLLRHGTENEVCDVCNKKFKTKISLKEHKLSHTDVKYSCEYCEKIYTRKKGLKDHQQRIHSENPVDCTDCGEKFKNMFLLTEHNKTKHATESFECSNCNKIFSLQRLLTKHENLCHTGVHSCVYCPKTFKNISSLRKHLNKVHLNTNLILKTEKFIEATNNSREETEVLLSIPETNTEMGKSLYILENGTMQSSPVKENIFVSETKENLVQSISIDLTNASFLKTNDPIEIITPTELLPSKLETDENYKLVKLETEASVAETEQQITLGKNAYILEDGTIVEPQEQGNVMIYILNQQINNE